MTSLQEQVTEIITDATAKVLRATASALGAATSSAPTSRTAKAKTRATRKAAPTRAPAKRAAKSKSKATSRPKRSPEEIDADKAAILKYVRSNPDQGIEQIGKALQRATADLSLPMKKLIEGGEIKTTGQKRATRYRVKGG